MKRKVECPGCGGEKTQHATLCHDCRKRAVRIGVEAVANRRARPHRDNMNRMSTAQRRAYHKKLGILVQLTGRPKHELKASYLRQASGAFGREITSTKQLTEEEASDLLDWLEETEEAILLAEGAPA
jgi:hypothetical protein